MTDNQGSGPPAGWFPDPSGAPGLRWWDGQRWTEYTHAAPPAQLPGYATVDPRRAVEEERTVARWARQIIVAYAVMTLVGMALAVRMFAQIEKQITETMANPEAPPDPYAMYGMDGGAGAVYQFVNLLQLAAFVVLLVWVFRAANAAMAVGVPARRSPGWAVAGWFIPIGNLWLPCQSLRDLVPPDHVLRDRILGLWVTAIVAQLVAVVGLVVTFASPTVGGLLAGGGFLVVAACLVMGRSVIDGVLASHEELLAQGPAMHSQWQVRW